MDWIALVQLIATVATLLTLVVLYIQIRVQSISTKNQVYQNFVNNSLEIDRILIQYPEMRQYVYSDTPINRESVDIPLLMSITELLIDVLENIEVFKDQIPRERIKGWMDFVTTVENSSAYKMYIEVHGSWYAVSSKEQS